MHCPVVADVDEWLRPWYVQKHRVEHTVACIVVWNVHLKNVTTWNTDVARRISCDICRQAKSNANDSVTNKEQGRFVDFNCVVALILIVGSTIIGLANKYFGCRWSKWTENQANAGVSCILLYSLGAASWERIVHMWENARVTRIRTLYRA